MHSLYSSCMISDKSSCLLSGLGPVFLAICGLTSAHLFCCRSAPQLFVAQWRCTVTFPTLSEGIGCSNLLEKWLLKLFLRLIALSDSPKSGWWEKRWSCRMCQRGRLVRSQIPTESKPDTFITVKSPLKRYKSNQNKRIVTNVKPQRPFSQGYIMEQLIRLLQTG